MKKIIFAISVLCCTASYGQSICVATYNIRNANAEDSLCGNGWGRRQPHLCKNIQGYGFDIFGMQEVLNCQLKDLLSAMPEYSYIGVGRDDGKEEGEYSPVFYRKDRFALITSGTFWLSPYIWIAGLKGWDAACPRICTWGEFKDRETGVVFFFFNTHFDHIGVQSRHESAMLLMGKVRKMGMEKIPVILCGDFNSGQKDEPYTILGGSPFLKDSYAVAQVRERVTGTFNEFNPQSNDDTRIDHIFVSPQINVLTYDVITDTYNASDGDAWQGMVLALGQTYSEVQNPQNTIRVASDHYPVAIHITMPAVK